MVMDLNKLQKPIEELQKKINRSYFFITDDKAIHRLVGLCYDRKTMYEPEITFVCIRAEMAIAKQLAYMSGKKIYNSSKLSATLFRKYQENESLEDCFPILAKLLAKYFYDNEKHMPKRKCKKNKQVKTKRI